MFKGLTVAGPQFPGGNKILIFNIPKHLCRRATHAEGPLQLKTIFISDSYYGGAGLIRTVLIRTIGLIRTDFQKKTFNLSILIYSFFYRLSTRKFKSNLQI